MSLQVVFFGTSEFAVAPLAALADSDSFKVIGVVTQPDRPSGRKQELTPSPVKIFANDKNIPVLQPENFKNKDIEKLLVDMKADFFIVASYGQILPKKILDLPKYGSFNIHASLLPKYRGASPIQEVLLNGDEETGISIIKMNEKMDQGDLIFLKKIKIDPSDDYDLLEKKTRTYGVRVHHADIKRL